MKILIVGNDPHEIGGVANYTRPLATCLAESGHQVYYFYSGAYGKKYNWFFFPYLRIDRKSFPFECAQVMNSPNLVYNFDNPTLDIRSPKIERLFKTYLDRVRPDVVHIHSRCGLPSSIAGIAGGLGVPVFSTIHVYGFLCQKRVMIDRAGEPCTGPENLEKCAICGVDIGRRKFKFTSRLDSTSNALTGLLVRMKHFMRRAVPSQKPSELSAPAVFPSPFRVESQAARLRFNVEMMNKSINLNICVSEDVKNTLRRHGVRNEKLQVQHIGSVIAEKQIFTKRPLHSPLVIGNIGGVNYYKGTHILVEAVSKLATEGFVVRIFGKYQQDFVDKIMAGKMGLPVVFEGRYLPEDLPEILDQIDIMVLPSICNDTAPQTIFESFSQYVPIIAPNIGGFPDFVRHEVNGLLFRAGDSDELAEKLKSVILNPECIGRYRQNIPRLKTIRENVDELIMLYDRQIKQSARL